jgi:hypothetical protein
MKMARFFVFHQECLDASGRTYVVDKEGKIIMILTVCWLRKHIQARSGEKLTLRKADNSSYKLQNTESCL